MSEGTLVLVVGPSGAGKDSVLNGARAALDSDDRFVFVRRTITRESGAGGEDNVSVTPEAFASARDAGEFCLSWQAHGPDYGIPRTVEADLRARRCVVANVSRSVIDTARSRYASVRVVNVTAPIAVLAQRIAQRGREDAAAIERRLERARSALPPGGDIVDLENTGTVEAAVDRFVALLRETL